MITNSRIWVCPLIVIGLVLIFTTDCKKQVPEQILAVLSTTPVTDITITTATSGGNITSDGGATIIAKGVCWSTDFNPTITDDKTVDGVGSAQFVSSLNGLTAGTAYHVRAYATNSAGTAYGVDWSFTTYNSEMAVLTHKLTDEISADTLESLVVWLEGMGTRYALADNHRDVAENIKRRFIMVGYPDTRLDSFMISDQQWQYNVIAYLEGSANPDSVCIIGGHYDDRLMPGDMYKIVPGANDNASGVAAAIELARVMKKNSYLPLNTIEFIAFADEEFGILGSKAYAGQALRSAKKIKMMLNNDMIAYQPGTNLSDWVVNIMDYDNSHGLRKEAEQMCSRFTFLRFTNDNTNNDKSDSFRFFSNGYKALWFHSNNFNSDYYHSLKDVSANCNFEYCSEIVKICCALLVYNN